MQCNFVTSELRQKKHSTEFNCEARQANKFMGMTTAQSGPRGFLLLFYFYLSASKCLTQSSQQALQPDVVNHFTLIPRAHSNTEHILEEKGSSNSPVSTLHFHKQIFRPLTEQFIDRPQVLVKKKKKKRRNSANILLIS